MSAASDAPIVIAGAGFVGAALGIGLARQGLPVLIVDAQPRPDDRGGDGRGLALNRRTVDLLGALDLWPALVSSAYPIRHIHVTQQGHFGALRLDHTDLDVPALGHVCPADALQRALLAGLAAAPTLRVCWSSSITALQPEPAALHLTLRTPAGSEHCSAALLIGADGLASGVRALAGIGVQRHAYGQTAIVTAVDVERPRPHTAFERFTTSGPLALLPLGTRRHVLVRTARSSEVDALLALPDAAFLADAAARFGHAHGAFSALGPRRAHPLVLARAERISAPRTLLLGNAAHTLHPNAAQGLNLGLRDVAEALTLLGGAAARGEDPGDAALLQTYVAQRAGDQRATVRFTDTLARTFAVDSALFGTLRAAALAGADRLPFVKRVALRRLALGQAAWG